MASFAAVIPVFNERGEIAATLDGLDAAIARTSFDAEIVLVDDGSNDGTADAAAAWSGCTRLSVVRQENQGRFAARRRGLESTGATYCLLIDSRVRIRPDSLAIVEEQLSEGPAKEVWNAHVDIETDGNPFGVFWDVLTRRAFWAYFREPRTTSFGLENFEAFPKGTTCFFAPRDLLVEAFDSFRTSFRDMRHANDDTPVIRWIAARRPINISPRFSCIYRGRRRLRPFLAHAYHRGTVFLDGHGRRESRFFVAVVAFYPATVIWVVLSVWFPWFIAAPFVAAALGGAALALAERRGDAVAAMAAVTPLYATAHALGMWRGLALALRNGLARAPR